jgi:aldehyde:ferredoxin oxidoreductase
MRKAGYWAIAIKGIAKSPTYIVIDNQDIRFEDATSLWGIETAEAQRAMLGDLSSKKAATVAIGPAGEQLIKYASVFSEGNLYRCFGRGGAGAVMGSKRLKGMLMTGSGEVNIGDKAKFEGVKREIAHQLRTKWKNFADTWRRYETGNNLGIMNEMGMIPTRNWQTGQFDGWRGIDKSTTPMGWPEKGYPCGPNCLTPGCRLVEIKEGPYKGAHSDVEWETIYAFGSVCGIDKMDAVIAASQICDEFGIDTMTAGITIGFSMECFEKGLISTKDTDGIQLRFGNDEAMIAMLKKLATQEGFGKQLAKGTKRLSEDIKGSEVFAMQVKGMELGGYECRGLNGQALQFAIDNRGGCHHGYGLPARQEQFDGTRLNVAGKGQYVKDAAIGRIVRDSIIVCTFMGGPINNAILTDALSALFKEPWSIDDLAEVGVRVMCQERLFNMREGITRKDDTLPARLLIEPKPDGPTKGQVIPLDELLNEYYSALGWDIVTGNPTDKVLDHLGIER